MECKIVIPPHDRFTPAEVAYHLKKRASSVQYWLDKGKLTWAIDDRGRRVVLRSDLVVFAKEYLGYIIA